MATDLQLFMAKRPEKETPVNYIFIFSRSTPQHTNHPRISLRIGLSGLVQPVLFLFVFFTFLLGAK